MRPAFTSLQHKLFFTVVVFLVLAGPWLAGPGLLPSREQVYSANSWNEGAFPYLHDQLFVEKGDIDIAFMGGSTMWWAMDTPYVQDQLSRALGRPATVRTLCWYGPGFDTFYFVAKDLLEHRRVHLIVFNDLGDKSVERASWRAPGWFQFSRSRDELAGLSWPVQLSFYNAAIIGLPRNLLGLLRPNSPARPLPEITWLDYSHIPNPSLYLGAFRNPTSTFFDFTNYTPAHPAAPSEVIVFDPAHPAGFAFGHGSLPPAQIIFARKIAALARQYHVQLVYLHTPALFDEFGSPVVPEHVSWPAVFSPDQLTLIGIPSARLYAGMPTNEVCKFYENATHFDLNGQKYFTSVITPRLLQTYETRTEP